ncbi:MAG: hypothetical protein AB1921_02785 [Thermodesulfobacteriota bacterium]
MRLGALCRLKARAQAPDCRFRIAGLANASGWLSHDLCCVPTAQDERSSPHPALSQGERVPFCVFSERLCARPSGAFARWGVMVSFPGLYELFPELTFSDLPLIWKNARAYHARGVPGAVCWRGTKTLRLFIASQGWLARNGRQKLA